MGDSNFFLLKAYFANSIVQGVLIAKILVHGVIWMHFVAPSNKVCIHIGFIYLLTYLTLSVPFGA